MKKEFVYIIQRYNELDLNEAEVIKDGCLQHYVSDMYKNGRVSRPPKDELDALDILTLDDNYIVVRQLVNERS